MSGISILIVSTARVSTDLHDRMEHRSVNSKANNYYPTLPDESFARDTIKRRWRPVNAYKIPPKKRYETNTRGGRGRCKVSLSDAPVVNFPPFLSFFLSEEMFARDGASERDQIYCKMSREV